MIRALITDLDDTLYPWADFFVPAFYALAEKTARLLGVPMERLLDEYRIAHQKLGDVETPYATLELPTVRMHLAGFSREEQIERLSPAFRAYADTRAERLQLHRDVESVLERLRQAGVRIFACTESAGANSMKKLRALRADRLVDHVYVAAGKYRTVRPGAKETKLTLLDLRKPDPLILQHILLKEQLLPEDVLYVGDSMTKDIAMARAAGVPCVLVRHPETTGRDTRLYEKLAAVSSWTPEEAEYEDRLRSACRTAGLLPDHEVSRFSDIPEIALAQPDSGHLLRPL